MMESIKAFLLNSILESIEKQQQIVLPWWWVFLPTSWKKEFSELLMVAIPLMKTTSEHTYARKPRFATGILGTVVATMMTLLLLTSTSIHMNPRSMAYKAAGRGEQRLGSTFVSPFEASAMGLDEALVECTIYHIQAPPEQIQALLSELNAVSVPEDLNYEGWVVDQKRLLAELQYRAISPEWFFSATTSLVDKALNSFLIHSGFEDPVLVVQMKTH